MNDIEYIRQRLHHLLCIPQERIEQLAELVPYITVTLEKDTDKLSPRKKMNRMKKDMTF